MSHATGDDGSILGPDEHERLRVLIGGHLLGGAEPNDEARLAPHLQSCASCRAELSELAGLVNLLALPARDLDRPPLPATLKRRVLVAGTAAQHRRRSPARWLAVPAAAAALALLLGVAIGGGLQRSDPDTAVGDAVSVQLTSASAGPTGRALLRAEDGVINIDLAVTGLEAADALRTYELWLVHDEGRVSAGTFRPRPDGNVKLQLSAAGPITRYNRVGITLEPDDRDPSRNGATVIAGTLAS